MSNIKTRIKRLESRTLADGKRLLPLVVIDAKELAAARQRALNGQRVCLFHNSVDLFI
jgi:hypothetical protein